MRFSWYAQRWLFKSMLTVRKTSSPNAEPRRETAHCFEENHQFFDLHVLCVFSYWQHFLWLAAVYSEKNLKPDVFICHGQLLSFKVLMYGNFGWSQVTEASGSMTTTLGWIIIFSVPLYLRTASVSLQHILQCVTPTTFCSLLSSF